MRTASGQLNPLLGWCSVSIGVEGVWRDIKCFVSPPTGKVHLILLLGIPWFHSVDAKISVREAAITIGNAGRSETPRSIVGPELVHFPKVSACFLINYHS